MTALVSSPRERHLPIGESVTRTALAMLSTQPLTWAASPMTTILVPRLLGAVALGQFTIGLTIAGLATTATNLGISESLVRRIAQQPFTLRRVLGVALLVQMLVTSLGAVVIVALAPLGVSPVTNPRLLNLALLGMFITPGLTVLSSSFRGRELHVQYGWFNAAASLVGQVGGALALFAGADVLVYMGIIGASTTTVTLVGLLGLFVPAAEVGWYAAAFRIIRIPIFIPTLIITPLSPPSAGARTNLRRSAELWP